MFGKIYETTWWGFPTKTGWGNIYYDLASSIVSFFTNRITEDGGTLETDKGIEDIDTDASLTMLPRAYKDGTLYSVLPEDGTGDFDVVRGGSATRVNASGLIESVSNNEPRINYEGFSYQYVLGSELVTNGDFATDSDWTKDANWSIADGVATSTGDGRMFQSVPFLETNVGTTVKVSFDITERTSDGVQINCYGAVSQVYTDVGTHTFVGTTTNALNLYVNNSGEGDLVGSIDNVSVKEVLGQEVVPDSGSPVLLLEPQSTNLAPFSEDFTSWGDSGNPVLSNNQPSPDGGNNSYLFENSSNGDRLQQSLGILSAGTYTQSIFVKYNDGDVRMNFKNNQFGSSNVFLITSSGVTADTPDANRHVEDYGNGWFRIGVTYTADGTSGTFIQLFGDLDTPKNGFYIFGAQLEEQSKSTSYIKTNGAIATRLADSVSGAGDATTFNSTEGVLYAEIAALATDGNDSNISLSDGTGNNRIYIYYLVDDAISVIYNINSSGAVINNFTLSDITSYTKIAARWGNSKFSVWINGTEVLDVAASNFTSNTLDLLNFAKPTSTGNFFGKVKALSVYKEALSDAELTELTTI